MHRRVYLHTLGCEKNEADSRGMRSLLRQAGYELVDSVEHSDAVVINTCGFIEPAVEESVSAIVQACDLKNAGGVDKVVVVGCLVSRSGPELREQLPEVDVFLGTAAYHKIVRALRPDAEPLADAMASAHYLFEAPLPQADEASTYAWVKIGEGCSRDCSFCTIPSFRGRQRSKRPDSVIEELKHLAGLGVQEAILVSQDSTQYGQDLRDGTSLIGLLERIEAEPDLPTRVRLHYTFPGRMVQEIIPLLGQARRLCAYLDMPIQHTDPAILQAMHRPRDRDWLLRTLTDARARYPHMWMRSTVIVGHPGETEASIQQLAEDLELIGFDYLSAFRWSPEQGTTAAQLPASYELQHSREWLTQITGRQADITERRLRSRLGQVLEVLIDRQGEDGAWEGRTVGQSPNVDGAVLVEGLLRPGQIVAVRIEDVIGPDLFGSVASGRGLGGIPILPESAFGPRN